MNLNLVKPVRRLPGQMANLLGELPSFARQMLRTIRRALDVPDDALGLRSDFTNLALGKLHLTQVKRKHLLQRIQRRGRRSR